MARTRDEAFSLSNLYLAYRKAKAEAFYENTHYHALEFTKYEQHLHLNLKRLRSRLVSRSADWFSDCAFIGDHAYLPKSVDCEAWNNGDEGHFRALDPLSDWERRFQAAREPASASLRLVIRPTVDFQIVSALWILQVGHLFDAVLNQRASFGNRLRRSYAAESDPRIAAPGVNLTTPGLFAPYFPAYRDWREGGLNAMENSLRNDESILAITMDIEKFYHRVAPKFLLRRAFLDAVGLTLDAFERRFTLNLLAAIETWYRQTPDFSERPDGAIPVGLSASKIIANVLLVEFDKAIVDKLDPIYYGRYVDDIFLIIRATDDDYGAQAVTNRLIDELKPLVSLKKDATAPGSLRLRLPYARDSELIFAGPKQKIFALSSEHGADLVQHIRDQIRQQSSEYRLLPSVPEKGVAMASRALLATPDASLQVDALRKADVVSVRRLGFALLLSDIETYAADLRPDTWSGIRHEFYGLVKRHVITPTGFFQYLGYVPRVFGLMLLCGDTKDAKALIAALVEVANLLSRTTTLGESANRTAFDLCLEQYTAALLQAGLQAATARSIELNTGYLGVLRKLKSLSRRIRIPSSIASMQALVKQILLADWGRRPYKEYWYLEQNGDETGAPVPRELAVRRQLRLGAIRKFRKDATDLKMPHWPALAFPTRPFRVDEIALAVPKVLTDRTLYMSAIKLLRGAGVASKAALGFDDGEGGSPRYFNVPGKPKQTLRIAVTSIETTDAQWGAAALGKHDRSVARYAVFNGLINRILREVKRPDYIVMPELCIPLRWAIRAARKLAMNGVSLLAGVEYSRDRATKKLRNDCLISLTTHWPGYASSVVSLQPKFLPAHGERAQLRKLFRKDGMFNEPTGSSARPTIYCHKQFYFSALICSDLTNISHRHELRGHIDALFALEWNPDTKTFSALVESAASDLHAFVVQANNRLYGDSRIRAPIKEDFARDVVQVKGGVGDYYVVGEIDYLQLRKEQRRAVAKPQFKPVPIGYVMSSKRKSGIRKK